VRKECYGTLICHLMAFGGYSMIKGLLFFMAMSLTQ
jgi:hypothetical protein